VDVYPNQGKRLGAFSSGAQGTSPFIMMSYSDDLQGMSTLAHELGHSMHSYLTWENQPWLYARYSMFVAEVASNFNQAMTRAHLLATNDDPEFQIAVIEEAMANFYRYFFVMPNLARFEYEVHSQITQGKGLTADALIEIMVGLLQEGYGSAMHIDHDRLGIEWGTFGHLYVPFYTFQYATGISGAHALSARILDGEEGAAESYLDFLRLGGGAYPIDALKVAGVDLSTPEPVEETFSIMASMIDRLEELVANR
jgi:oligoendopeptidase F